MSLAGRWSAILDGLRAEGRYRQLSLSHGIDLASNDYLGYGGVGQDSNPVGKETGLEFCPTVWPRSGTASRLLRGQHAIWDEVETALARWHGAEATLMMTSGY